MRFTEWFPPFVGHGPKIHHNQDDSETHVVNRPEYDFMISCQQNSESQFYVNISAKDSGPFTMSVRVVPSKISNPERKRDQYQDY